MSFIIGCDSFLALRNVRNGGLGRCLPGLCVLADPTQLMGSLAACPEGVRLKALVDFKPGSDPAFEHHLHETYLARKAYYDGRTVWSELAASSYRSHGENLPRRLGSLGVAGARLATGWLRGACGAAQRGRRQCADALRRHPLAAGYFKMFKELNPSAVVAFSLEGSREMLLLEAANSAGLPTAVMIRSRDNLAAKIQHLPDAASYFVWSEALRDCLLHIYPEISPQRVQVTGSPQFDRHLDPACRLSRADFFAQVGLDAARPLVVYSMATPGLIEHEIEITQHLADAAHAGRLARRAQLLVRGHPRMFGSDVRLLHREYAEAKAFPGPGRAQYRSAEHEAGVVRLVLEDEPMHLATLAYQDVQVNVCGTMTIDSAIFDKPVVSVYFDLPESVLPGLSVRRFYERSDVRMMMDYGASRLAHSAEECVRLINQYLDDPTLDAAGRQRARAEDCGPLDGHAGRRIAKSIAALAGKPVTELACRN